ncbi:MAG: protoporphyrinogen oxidase [Bacteroidia bacterium]|nr:protoporphyrinogen oxidase [Bacteroidia bacterium]
MNITSSADVVVVGSGISGLTCAFLLQRSGKTVLVLEQADRFGGAIRSERRDGWLIEAGPNSTLETTPLLTELIRDAGVENKKLYADNAANNRYILRAGVLLPLPMSPPKFIATKLFSWKAKLRLFREPFIAPSSPDAQESVGEFVRRRLGKEFLDYAINPFVAGVYAGDPALLSVRASFPKLFELEQKYGSLIKGQLQGARERKRSTEKSKQSARMFSFTDGMQTLTDAIAERLPLKVMGATVISLTRSGTSPNDRSYTVRFVTEGQTHTVTASTIIIATPAQPAADLTRSITPGIDDALQSVPYPPVAEVLTGFRRQPGMHALDGFGFLIPKVEQRRILGTIFSSTIFSDRAPEGHVLLTTFIGGMRQPEEAERDHAGILETALSEQHALLGTPMEPVFSHVTSWKHAIPQYVDGHLDRMRIIDDAEAANPGLLFCANYRGGISVGDCVKSAHAVVEKILTRMV